VTLLEVAAKNALRNKFRTTMTILGGAVAVLAFVLIRTIIVAWNKGVDYAAKDRLATRDKVSMVISLPKHYIDDVRTKIPGVKAASYLSWAGAKWPKDPNVFFANMAADENVFDLYPEMEISPDAIERWHHDKQGAIVGTALAHKLGWNVGDKVVLAGSIYPGDWQYTIDGIYGAPPQTALDQSSFFFHWSYLNDGAKAGMKDKIGWIVTRVDDPSKSAEVTAAIDKLFDDQDTQTTTMSEHAMNQGFLGGASAILSALGIVSIIIMVIMMLILGNTIAMAVRERTSEYGVLRALGFQPGHVRMFVIGEALTVSLLAGLVGLALSYPFIEFGMGRWLEENMGNFFPAVHISPVTAATAFGATFVLGGLASLIPAIQAGRLQVTDALRRVA
jgi:putative ABC transport system permease protein